MEFSILGPKCYLKTVDFIFQFFFYYVQYCCSICCSRPCVVETDSNKKHLQTQLLTHVQLHTNAFLAFVLICLKKKKSKNYLLLNLKKIIESASRIALYEQKHINPSL